MGGGKRWFWQGDRLNRIQKRLQLLGRLNVVNNKSYLDEQVAKAVARLQDVEAQTLPFSDESYEQFIAL